MGATSGGSVIGNGNNSQRGLLAARITLESSQMTINFPSIDQGFDRIWIRCHARGTTGLVEIGMLLSFNSDTGSNYYRQRNMAANGGADNAGSASREIAYMPASSSTANAFGDLSINIEDYSGAHLKNAIAVQISPDTSTSLVPSGLITNHWNNVAAITSIDLTCASGDYAAGSWFELWAEKGVLL